MEEITEEFVEKYGGIENLIRKLEKSGKFDNIKFALEDNANYKKVLQQLFERNIINQDALDNYDKNVTNLTKKMIEDAIGKA